MSNLYDAMIMRLSFLRMCRAQIALDRNAAIADGRFDESDLMNAAEDDILEAIGSMIAICDHLKNKKEGE